MKFRSILFCAALAGCGATTPTSSSDQLITGTVSASGAVGVRAVIGTTVVATAATDSSGAFALEVPANTSAYRLELVTSSGAEPVLAEDGSAYRALSFHVCHPSGDPVDVGDIGGHTHGHGGGSGSGGPHGPPHGGSGSGSAMPNPPPNPPTCDGDGSCHPPGGGEGMCPEHPPGDIGCAD